jgi:hypothetical protein
VHVDAINAFGVSAGRVTSFRVIKSIISAAQAILCVWFESRQLHKNGQVRTVSSGQFSLSKNLAPTGR